MLRTSRILPFALAAAMLMAPAAANAATKSKVAYPTIVSISPKKLAVGQVLTITGKNFRAGKNANTVVFKRDGKPAVFVKSDISTYKMLRVKVPTKVGGQLKDATGIDTPTVFRLRIITKRFMKTYTSAAMSPTISPALPVPAGAAGGGANTALTDAYQACLVSATANPAGDNDNDGLSNATEQNISHTDPCTADTDGDGLIDGYEYNAAVDLNSSALPYPGKRPWPNPLDPTDVNYDFDGDGLLLWQEYKLWKAAGGTFPITVYSDGKQNTGGSQPVTTVAQSYLDTDHDGNLTDDERDFDGDGLSNMVEFNSTGTQDWWRNVAWSYQPHGPSVSYTEPWYTKRAFSDLDPTNPDTDGDGVPDGADDQDNDGWSNYVEMQLGRNATRYRVHPFNPCLPDPHSPTCSRYIPLTGTAWPPWDKINDTTRSQMPGDAIPFGWPNVNFTAWQGAGSNPPAGALLGSWNPIAGFFTAGWDGYGGPQGP